MADVNAQLAALETLAGRILTDAEKASITPSIATRNDIEIAKQLSVGRTRYAPTQIGPGTVLAAMGERGGLFLDAVAELGLTDRGVYWGMDAVRRGVLDLSVPAAPYLLSALKVKMPSFALDIDKVLKVGLVEDKIDYNLVSNVLNNLDKGA